MTLGEDYPNEQQRCRELLKLYEEIGPAGSFGAATIRGVLLRADEALANNDVVAMIRAYEEMKGCKE